MKKSIFAITVACALLTASFANAQTAKQTPKKDIKMEQAAPAKQATPVKTKATTVKAAPAKETKAVKPATKAPASK